ncbi:hypothetical protein GDO81_029889 [Engystomops pustulosus]|uniref:Uncharacterized protein n=1 Tax=Engystomops pustulosus TaxID=76066 RepID=A0AAV6YLP5_ENGPU|nr:hypothetical protein GDO81_029889 [Engystomops pustulosus]
MLLLAPKDPPGPPSTSSLSPDSESVSHSEDPASPEDRDSAPPAGCSAATSRTPPSASPSEEAISSRVRNRLESSTRGEEVFPSLGTLDRPRFFFFC